MDNKVMLDLKPKEPLLSVIFSLLLAGLGQVYAGRLKRGVAVFSVALIYSLFVLVQLLTPFMGLRISVAEHFNIFIILGFIFSLDSFYCTIAYNRRNSLIRKKSYKKDIVYIFSILLMVFFCNPFHVFAYASRFYLAECIKIRQDRTSLQLRRGDEVVANKFIYKISEPKRNDVGLFKNSSRGFIARIVGLPHDVVEIGPGKILINGSVVKEFAVSSLNNNLYTKIEIRPKEYFVVMDSGFVFPGGEQGILMPKRFLKGKIYKIYYPISRVGLVK